MSTWKEFLEKAKLHEANDSEYKKLKSKIKNDIIKLEGEVDNLVAIMSRVHTEEGDYKKKIGKAKNAAKALKQARVLLY